MSKVLSILFDGETVHATWDPGLGTDHFAAAARLMLQGGIREVGHCGCAGCAAARPHFEAALASMVAAETASAEANWAVPPTTKEVGSA